MDIFAKQSCLEKSELNEVIQDIETSLNAETTSKDEIQEPTTEAEIVSEQADIKLPALFVNANTNVAIPTDPNELIEFITVQKTAVKLGESLLKKPNLPKGIYQNIFISTQRYAELLLDAELEISKQLKKLPKSQGRRNKTVKTKADLIAEMGLTIKQARAINTLDEECVERAKNMAREGDDIVSRNLAIRMKRKTRPEDHQATKVDYIGEFATDSSLVSCAKYTESNPLYYTQLFANVGIGEYYLHELNVINAVANELIERRANWYREVNFGCKMINGDINDDTVFNELVKLHHEKDCKMILASPPCQPFSQGGSKDYNSSEAALFLRTIEFVQAVDDVNQFVMIENVPEFLNACPKVLSGTKYQNIAEYIKGELEALGYIVNIGILDAANYGTCQCRKRAIITASKNGLWIFPCPDKYRPMLWECIGDLPSIEAGEDSGIPYHVADPLPRCQVEVLKHTPTGCSAHNNQAEYKPKNVNGKPSNAQFETSFKRKSWEKTCNTVVTQTNIISGYTTIHPGRPLSDGTYSDARYLTILELLRVSGLPDNYPIPEWADDSLIREVIGEAFMPKLVKRLIQMLPKQY